MAEDIYEELEHGEPDRASEIDEEDLVGGRSATESEGTNVSDSDLESVLKRLFPKVSDKLLNDIAEVIMLGRVFPDNFSRKVYLITQALAKASRHDPDFNVVMTSQKVEGLCQIGLEGKGRVEAVIVSGNTKEQAEMETSKGGTF